MEPKGSLPHSQVSATCLYPELNTKSHVPFPLFRSYQGIGQGSWLL